MAEERLPSMQPDSPSIAQDTRLLSASIFGFSSSKSRMNEKGEPLTRCAHTTDSGLHKGKTPSPRTAHGKMMACTMSNKDECY